MTPIQEILKFMDENWGKPEIEKDSWLKLIYHELEWQLPKEKEFVAKIWERSMNSTYDNTHYDKEDECLEMDFSFVEKMKQQFINQLYPEK